MSRIWIQCWLNASSWLLPPGPSIRDGSQLSLEGKAAVPEGARGERREDKQRPKPDRKFP